ncbi:hypothetical protein Hanom_Chr16g01506511 [Helianthus anomalus]
MERRAKHRDTGHCNQGRLLDRRQALSSPRCTETRPLPARRHGSEIIGKTSPTIQDERRQPYSSFTWMSQKIMERVGVEPGSQGTPSLSQPIHHYLIG